MMAYNQELQTVVPLQIQCAKVLSIVDDSVETLFELLRSLTYHLITPENLLYICDVFQLFELKNCIDVNDLSNIYLVQLIDETVEDLCWKENSRRRFDFTSHETFYQRFSNDSYYWMWKILNCPQEEQFQQALRLAAPHLEFYHVLADADFHPALEIIQAMPKLRLLSVASTHLDRYSALIKHSKTLQWINLTNDHVSAVSDIELQKLLSYLKARQDRIVLHLDFCATVESDSVLFEMIDINILSGLIIDDGDPGPDFVDALALSQLDFFDVSCAESIVLPPAVENKSHIGLRELPGLNSFKKIDPSKLVSLNLEATRIDDQDFRIFLSRAEKLVRLDISNCNLSSYQMNRVLNEICQVETLETLSIGGENAISLSQLTNFLNRSKSLKSLDISGITQFPSIFDLKSPEMAPFLQAVQSHGKLMSLIVSDNGIDVECAIKIVKAACVSSNNIYFNLDLSLNSIDGIGLKQLLQAVKQLPLTACVEHLNLLGNSDYEESNFHLYQELQTRRRNILYLRH